MTRISLALLAGVAVLGCASAALSADLYSNDTGASPGFLDMASSGGWDGAFVGGFIGYGWGTVTDDDSVIAAPGLPSDQLDAAGWLIGANLGANFTVSDGFVLGAVGDVAWSTISGYDAGTDVDYDINWAASLRGRAGFDAGAFMPYLTAGLAVAGATADEAGAESGQVHFGWTAGAGVEVAATDNLSVDLQYRYSDYGAASYDIGVPTDLSLTTHTVTAGVNYSF